MCTLILRHDHQTELLWALLQIQAPWISYLPLLLPDIKRHLAEIVLDDAATMKEEDWWFEETGTGNVMKR